MGYYAVTIFFTEYLTIHEGETNMQNINLGLHCTIRIQNQTQNILIPLNIHASVFRSLERRNQKHNAVLWMGITGLFFPSLFLQLFKN